MKEVSSPRSLKWLDYRALIEKYLLRNMEYNKLYINFYTAINTFKFDKNGNPHPSIENHKTYTKALKLSGVKIIEGKFKIRDEQLNSYYECKNCYKTRFIHKINLDFPQRVICPDCKKELLPQDLKRIKKVEEKKTDVKIAIDLVNCTRDGHYNKIFFI